MVRPVYFVVAGDRDANEGSRTELVAVVRRMVVATSITVLIDGDCGFGISTAAVVRKLDQRGAAGLALKDKRFSKMNSFGGHPRNGDGNCAAGLRSRLIASLQAWLAPLPIWACLCRSVFGHRLSLTGTSWRTGPLRGVS